jgi:dihydrolipoamide dehydrogenase
VEASTYDLVVLGGGPAGYVAAIRGAQLGARTCVVEQTALGGTCLNRGCIPTKALAHSAAIYALASRAEALGVVVSDVRFDLEKAMSHKTKEVKTLVEGLHHLFKARKVELVEGAGQLAAPGVVEVDGRSVRGNNIILATGSEPLVLPGFDVDGEKVVTSTELLELETLPQSLLIAGGSVVGCEFASIFSLLGTRVTLVEMLSRLVPTEDEEVSRRLTAILKRRGVDVRTGLRLANFGATETGVVATAEDGEKFEADLGLVALGRALNVGGLGLEKVGVAHSRKGIEISDGLETSAPGVYAAGDVTGMALLAHAAFAQGAAAAANALGGSETVDYGSVPNAIFTEPEIGSVGMTERAAREEGYELVIGRFPFAASGRARTMGEKEGFVKVVADREGGDLLGVHMIGPHVSELLGEASLAIRTGARIEDLVATIHAHPTLAEAVQEAAMAAQGFGLHSL